MLTVLPRKNSAGVAVCASAVVTGCKPTQARVAMTVMLGMVHPLDRFRNAPAENSMTVRPKHNGTGLRDHKDILDCVISIYTGSSDRNPCAPWRIPMAQPHAQLRLPS